MLHKALSLNSADHLTFTELGLSYAAEGRYGESLVCLERALELDFVREGRNLVLLGSNGLGKTMIAKNVAYQAAMNGLSVLFTTAAEIIEDLRSCSPEALRRRLARYTRPQLLCIDEVGYLSYDSYAADLLYKVVDRRYEQPGKNDPSSRSILLTTNLAFGDWNTVFPNAGPRT